MTIEIGKRGSYFTADCKELPGSPRLGFGKTHAEAVADLFCYIFREGFAPQVIGYTEGVKILVVKSKRGGRGDE